MPMNCPKIATGDTLVVAAEADYWYSREEDHTTMEDKTNDYD